MTSVYLHCSTDLNTPTFWNPLRQAAHLVPQHTHIVVQNHQQKEWVIENLKLPDAQTLLPQLVSIDDLLSIATGRYAEQTPAMDAFLMRQALLSTRSEFPDFDGLIQELLKLKNTLFQHTISYTRYIDSQGRTLRNRSTQIIRCFEHFDTLCSQLAYHSFHSLFNELSNTQFSALHPFCQKKHIYIVGFLDLPPYLKELLNTLFSIADSAAYLLPYDTVASEESFLDNTYTWLSQRPHTQILHSTHETTSPEPRCYVANTAHDECQWVAKTVASFPHSSIGIISSSADTQLHSQLRQYTLKIEGLDASFSDHPLPHFLHALLSFLGGNFESTHLLDIFSSAYGKQIQYEEQELRLSSHLCDALSRTYTIRKGFSSWQKALQNPLHQSSESQDLYTGLRLLKKQASKSLNTSSAAFWVHAFKDLLALFGLPETEIEVTDYSGMSFIYRFLSELESLARYYDTLHPHTFSSTTFISVVQHFLDENDMVFNLKTEQTVTLLSLEESLWRHADSIFLPHFQDSHLPRIPAGNIFLSTQSLQHLQLPTPHKQYLQAWGHFSLLLHQQTPIILSYAPISASGHSTKSHFIYKLLSECGITIPEYDIYDIDTYSDKDKLLLNTPTPFSEHAITFNTESPEFKGWLDEARFSASQLDLFQSCPSQYFYRYVLKTRPLDTESEDIPAHQWGTLLHSIFQEYLEQIHQEKKLHDKDVLKAIATRHINKISIPSLFWDIKRDLLFGADSREGLLACYYKTLTQSPFKGVPVGLEMRINRDSPLPFTAVLDTLFVMPGTNTAYVLDYKTGKSIASAADIKELRHLQLPLYLYAAQQEHPELSLVGGIILHLNQPETADQKILMSTKEAKQDLFECGRKRPFVFDEPFFLELKAHLRRLHTLIQAGAFLPESHEILPHMKKKRAQTCKFCDYKHLCRYPERFSS